jgi:hypothetical protein
MPAVAVVLLTAAFRVVYWFVRMGGVDHFREQAARRKEEARKAEARELDRTARLRAVQDPRDAATIRPRSRSRPSGRRSPRCSASRMTSSSA